MGPKSTTGKRLNRRARSRGSQVAVAAIDERGEQPESIEDVTSWSCAEQGIPPLLDGPPLPRRPGSPDVITLSRRCRQLRGFVASRGQNHEFALALRATPTQIYDSPVPQ